MITPQPLIDPEDLTDTTDGQIARASAMIRDWCGWHIAPVQRSAQHLDTGDGVCLPLKSLRVVEVESVVFDADGSTVDLSCLSTRLREIGLLQRADRRPWIKPGESVTVTYRHGWDFTPESVKGVCVSLAKRLPKQETAVTQQSLGSMSLTYGGLLSGTAALSNIWTAAERAALDNHRIRNSR
jgi:hypothetical protein